MDTITEYVLNKKIESNIRNELSIRRIASGVTRQDRDVRNEIIRSNLKIKKRHCRESEVKTSQIFWPRRKINGPESLPSIRHCHMHGRVNGCRRGRSRKRWIDSVKILKGLRSERIMSVVEAERAAQDKHLWRTMLKTSELRLLYRKGAKEKDDIS